MYDHRRQLRIGWLIGVGRYLSDFAFMEGDLPGLDEYRSTHTRSVPPSGEVRAVETDGGETVLIETQ